MIDAQHHVELNGVKYRLAEDAQGEAYVLMGTSLRPPNSQQVLGDNRQKFQMRPDILLWTQTDWSGGEGQNLFDPSQPNRAWRLENVDPFVLPGRVLLGPNWDETDDSGGSDLTLPLALTHAMGGLWGVDARITDDLYEWNSGAQRWNAAVNNSNGSASRPAAHGGAAGDQKRLYYIEDNTDEVYSYDGTTFTLLNNQTGATGNSPMVAFGDYLYILDLVNYKIFEISKTTVNTSSAETAIVDFSASETATQNNGVGQLFVGDERVYFMQVLGDETIIWEITPTTAAGTGFGREVVRYDGLLGECSWFHLGTLFTVGTDDSAESNQQRRAIMYWQPNGSYGTLGYVRAERGVATSTKTAASSNLGGLLTSGFALPSSDMGTTDVANAVWQVYGPTGGFALLSRIYDPPSGLSAMTVLDLIEWQGQYFISGTDDTTNWFVMFTKRNTYSLNDGVVESPSWDFDLAEDKTLMSIQIACEPLEANASLEVFYSLDDAAYVSAGTYSTTSGVGTTFVVSTDTAEKTFARVRVRVDLKTSNSANTPVLTAVNVRAKAQQKGRKWRLLLDLSDDQSGTSQSHSGAKKITNIETAGNLGAVVDFKDGYQDRRADQYEQVDVTIDDYQIVLDRAGEGVALVELAEVV